MIVFKQKNWQCNLCNYTQDFEMTQEDANLHFNNDARFRLNNIKAGECPNCKLQGKPQIGQIKKQAVSTRMMKIIENQQDINNIYAEQVAQGKLKIHAGVEKRIETQIEKVKRAKDTANGKTSVEAQIMKLPDQEFNFPIYREETKEEFKERLNNAIAELKIATVEKIAEIRAKYEDK